MRSVLLFLIFIFVKYLAFSQDVEVSGIIAKLNSIVQKGLDSTEKFNRNISTDSTIIVNLSKIRTTPQEIFNDSLYFEAQRKALKTETYLALSSQFVQNFNPTQQDLEDNILYQRRVLTSLNWEVLKGGFFEGRSKLKSLALEEAFMNEVRRFSYKRENFPTKMNTAIYIFNQRKNELLAMRKELLEAQREQMEELYFLRKVSKESMLELNTKLAEVEALKEIYGTYNSYKISHIDTSVLEKDLPLFDINYLTIQKQFTVSDTLRELMLAEIEKQNNWFRQIRLNTFVRHSFYDLVTNNPATRSFFSAGIGVAVPLSFNTKQSTEAEKQKMLKRFDDFKTTRVNNEIDLLNEVYEYRYHLKQYVIFYQNRQIVLEKLRQERVKKKFLDADYNPINALTLIDQLFQIEVELLDIKQNLYIHLLKIHEKSLIVPIEDMLIPFELPNFDDFETKMHRSIYIWSKAFNENTLAFLSEFVVYNNFDEVMIAVTNDDTLLTSKKNFIDAVYEKGVKIDLMFGQNKLLSNTNKKDYLLQTLKNLPLYKINALHLDVEPHTFPEWDTEKKQLKNSYLELISDAKSLCKDYNLKLTVDLPVHLDDSLYIQQIAQQVDGIRLMCYENIKMEYLLRKIKFFSQFNTEISLSLRTEDFESRSKMEEFAKELVKQSGNENINFHDLGRLIKLDQKPLQSDEKY